MFTEQYDQHALLYIILHLLSSFDSLTGTSLLCQVREEQKNIEIPGFWCFPSLWDLLL